MHKKIRIVINILAILLTISVLGLAATLLYQYFHSARSTTVVVPDNLITPEPGRTAQSTRSNAITPDRIQPASRETKAEAAVISLRRRKKEDNVPFSVSNMFPGDAETKYYCVRVSHKSDAAVYFHADIRKGYEKLAEVLKCKVVLLTSEETLYDGLMKDMPGPLTCEISEDSPLTSELYYEITAYLDTSVGNDYQMKDLIADFRWWVVDSESLDSQKNEDDSRIPGEDSPGSGNNSQGSGEGGSRGTGSNSPKTGDDTRLLLYICFAAGALSVLLILARKNRREVGTDD